MILWQPDGTIINTLTDAKGLSSISFSPKKQIIITRTKDDRYKLWQLNGNFIAETRGSQFFNHDEQLIAISAVDDYKIIQLYQRDGTFTTLKGHQGSIENVAFHPTKSILATGSHDNTIKIWHIDGILLDTLTGHGDWITDIQFSMDGHKLASGSSYDQTLKIWQLDNKLLKVFRSDSTVFWAEKEHDEYAKNFITAIKDGPVKLWKANGEIVKKLMTTSQGQVQTTFGNEGQFFVTQIEKENYLTAPLKLWRTEDGHLIETLVTETQEEISFKFSDKDKFIITTVQGDNSYGPVQLWRTDNGKLVQTLLQKTSCEDGKVEINTTGQILVTTITCENIYGPVQLWQMDGTAKTLITAIESDENISGNVFVSDKWIATILQGNEFYGPLQLWNHEGTLVNTLIEETQKEKGDSIGFSVRFNDKTQALVTKITGTINDEYFYGPVQLWQNGISVTTLIEQIKNQELMRGVESFSSDGKLLVTGVKDESIKLWNSETGKLLKILIEKNVEYPRIVFSHDDKMLVASYEDGPIVLWRTTDNTVTTLLKSGNKGSIKFSPDNSMLIQKDGKVANLLQLNGQFISALHHKGMIVKVRFSPNNERIATTSYDNTIKLWQRDGAYLSTLTGHNATVNKVYFSPDGKKLLTTDEKGQVILRQIDGMNDLKTLQKLGCQWLKNYLQSPNIEEKYRGLCNGFIN